MIGGWAPATPPGYQRPIRWTSATGIQDLGLLSLAISGEIYGVSGNGLVCVGACGYTNPSLYRGFKWTQAGGMVDLGNPLGGFSSIAYDASNDGSVIVGIAYDTAGVSRAVQWTSTGLQVLPLVPGWGPFSEARAVSADGNVIVGNGVNAFRWTAATGTVDLGNFPGGSASSVRDVNADGSAIIGRGRDDQDFFRDFYWTASLGMVRLDTYLTSHGVNLAGWTFLTAWGISDDGSTLTGEGVIGGESRAWIVTGLPPTHCAADVGRQGGIPGGDGTLDNNDFVVFINLFFANDPRADFGRQGGVDGADGLFDNNDFVVFINRFFAGC